MSTKLVIGLLEQGEKGDNAIDAVLEMARNGEVQALKLIEEALELHSRKKLIYFTPGPRVSSGDDVYNSKVYEKLLKTLKIKARKKTLLNNAARTQDEIIRALNHVEADAGSLLNEVKEAGGWEAVKIIQLLHTHSQVQAQLIHKGAIESRGPALEEFEDKPWWRFW